MITWLSVARKERAVGSVTSGIVSEPNDCCSASTVYTTDAEIDAHYARIMHALNMAHLDPKPLTEVGKERRSHDSDTV